MKKSEPKIKKPRINWTRIFKGRTQNEISAMIVGMDIPSNQKSNLRRKFLRGGEKLTAEQSRASKLLAIRSDNWKVNHKRGLRKRSIELAKQKAKDARAEIKRIGKKNVLKIILSNKTETSRRRYYCEYYTPKIAYKDVSTSNKRLAYRVKLLMKKGITIGRIVRLVNDVMKDI